MRHNSLLPTPSLLPPRLPLQPLNRMERPSDLEGPNPLEILTLEPQPQDRLRRCSALPSRTLQLLRRAGCRGQVGEGAIGQNRRIVDERLDEFVSLNHRVPTQWKCLGNFGHL